MGKRSVPPDPAESDPLKPLTRAWSNARALIAAACASQAISAVLLTRMAPAPLLTALMATLTFAGVWLILPVHARTLHPGAAPGTRTGLFSGVLAVAGVSAGTLLIESMVGSASAYFCAPIIPWRIEIALFGGFMVGVLTRVVHARGVSAWAYPFVLLSLFWIAPFYGFFSGAVFLGIALVMGCADQGFIPILLAAGGMVTGKALGHLLADWLTKPPGDRQARR